MQVSLIVAMSRNRVIGADGGLPWRLRTDLRRFKKLTMGHTLVVGRVTWESIGRALPGRRMVVVTRQPGFQVPGVEVVGSLEAALEHARARGETEVFIGGGAQIYELALPVCDRIHLTIVDADVEGDTFFPELDEEQWITWLQECHEAGDGDDHPHSYWLYERRPPPPASHRMRRSGD